MKKSILLGVHSGLEIRYDPLIMDNGHVFIMGVSGSGKSTLMKNMAEQMTDLGMSVTWPDYTLAQKEIPVGFVEVCICDHRELTAGLWMDDPDITKAEKVQNMTEELVQIFGYGVDQKRKIFHCLNKWSCRANLLEWVFNEKNPYYQMAKTSSGFLGDMRLLAYALHEERYDSGKNIASDFGQVACILTGTDKMSPVDCGKCLLRFPKVAGRLNNVIVEMYLWSLWNDRVYGGKEKEPVTIFLDEAQTLHWGKDSIIMKILDQGRKYGINLVLAMQHLPKAQEVRDRLMQCSLIASFLPAYNETEAVAKMLSGNNIAQNLRNLSRGQCIVSGKLIVGKMIKTVKVKMNVPLFLRKEDKK